MITNIITLKRYIGQTCNSIQKRWAQHKSNAKRKANKCILLENSIRKHGDKNFRIEVLLHCIKEDMDVFEIQMISYYSTNHKDFGYNICDGGGGSVNRSPSEEHRKKISLANKQNTLPINILEVKDKNGILIGYGVNKVVNKFRFTKKFGNTKISLDENLRLATQYLEKINLTKVNDPNDYFNRKILLPTNISYHYNNKKVIDGYAFKKGINGKTHFKSFTYKDLSMEEKFQLVIEYKEAYLKELSNN